MRQTIIGFAILAAVVAAELATEAYACTDPVPPTQPPACTPLRSYPKLCREQIPWAPGADGQVFHEPALPAVDPAVTVQVTTAAQFCQQMKLGKRTIVIPAGVNVGQVQCGGSDVELVVLGSLKLFYLQTDYPSEGAGKCSQRMRVRGPGAVGAVVTLKTTGAGACHSADLTFDGLKFEPHALGAEQVSEPVFNLNDPVSRLAVVNSVARAGVSSSGGGSFLLGGGQDILVAGCNVDVPDASGPGNNWAVRLISNATDGSAARYVFADDRIDGGGEQAIFRQGGNGTGVAQRVDHTFLFRCTLTSLQTPLVLKDENCGTTDETYADQCTIAISGGSLWSVNFAAHSGSCALSRKWVVTNTRWLATSSDYVSDAVLLKFQNQCPAGTMCSYLQGNSYTYADLGKISQPWPVVHSDLAGADVGSDPALLP